MSDYILDLRKLVGRRPLMQVGASVIVVNDRGEMLLQLRSDNRCWSYAGGSVELFERVEETAVRELKEECGLTARSLTLYGVFSGPECHYVYPNGDEVSCVDIVFQCQDYEGTVCPQPGEVEELRFFAPDRLPEPLSPPTAHVIRRFAQERLKQGA